MTHTAPRTVTAEDMQEIYSNEKKRNAIAYAHQCADKYGNFLHFSTCEYPTRRIVTAEQIREAQAEIKRSKAEKIKTLGNKLVFVGMGCDYEPRFIDDVCNHRIRTNFKNKDGKTFFIEVGTGRGENLRVDHAIDKDLQNEYDAKSSEYAEKRNACERGSAQWHKYHELFKEYLKQPYNNYNGVERMGDGIKYTFANVLKLVNENFNCNFQEMEVDAYTLTTDDFTCQSPK